MAIHETDIGDVAAGTYAARRRKVGIDVASELQSYPAVERLLRKKVTNLGGGDEVKFTIITEGDDNHQWVGLYHSDSTAIVNGTVEGTLPWAHGTTSCMFDTDEINSNTPAWRIFNVLAKREYQMELKRVADMEAAFWDGPADSNDTETPKGLFKYWLDYDATSGFNGGNHANWTDGPGAISAATNTGHAHYTYGYTAVSDTDCYDELKSAIALTGFQGIPMQGSDIGGNEPGRYDIWTTYDVFKEFGSLLESKNDRIDQLGKWGVKGGLAMAGVPMYWAPYLQTNKATSDPIVGIDWNQLYVGIKSAGQWHKVRPYKEHYDKHNVRVMYVDDCFQIVMEQRRKFFLGAKSDPTSA